jgi:hypothetical protein
LHMNYNAVVADMVSLQHVSVAGKELPWLSSLFDLQMLNSG